VLKEEEEEKDEPYFRGVNRMVARFS